ncbi:unnamed protein product [Paramecium sonneborni]|uniref:Myb-like domain-containing protein n=1 Tax=Paramecium sonneborni TaxID=65129 RepID=A0A8S1KJZ0_9CILI|nr:unnamed protein product [Paramecium sonneborni]
MLKQIKKAKKLKLLQQPHTHNKILIRSDKKMSNYKKIFITQQIQILQSRQVCDITENIDRVYSLQFMTNNEEKQQSKAQNNEKMNQIRKIVKEKKDVKRNKKKTREKGFSFEEDQRLLKYILKKGPKFQKFSRQYPGKTTNMLKNRYYKQLRFVWEVYDFIYKLILTFEFYSFKAPLKHRNKK